MTPRNSNDDNDHQLDAFVEKFVILVYNTCTILIYYFVTLNLAWRLGVLNIEH